MPRIQPLDLLEFVTAIFSAAGAPPPAARIVAAHLVDSNLAGHDSHGVIRIAQYLEAIRQGRLQPGSQPTIVTETAAGGVLDGNGGFGQVAADRGMSLAMNKARECGIAGVTVRNCAHTGRLGSYTTQAARNALVGMAMVNAGGGGQKVAPFGGLSSRLATNPLSIAAPSGGEFPLLLDIATSVAPEGKVRVLAQQNKPLPVGWAIDAGGNPLSRAADFYSDSGAALLPLGGSAGHKGYGLAVMIDILAGALSGAGCCTSEPAAPGDGVLLVAIDVTRYSPLEAFQRQVAGLVDHLKSCPPAPGFEEVIVPGEREHREEQRRRREGIEVQEPIWREIVTLAAGLGVPAPNGDDR